MRKKIVLLLVGLLIILLVGGGFAWWRWYRPASPAANSPTGQDPNSPSEASARGKVVLWSPETYTLTYTLDSDPTEKTVDLSQPIRPIIVIPVSKPGETLQEDLITWSGNPKYKIAFCPGDAISFTYTGEELTNLRNHGPRTCF